GNGKILGCHMFGPHAADLIQEITVLMQKDGTLTDLRDCIHAHPTLSEVIMNAAM
ncbi:MAG: dihydrolipoyl dehydrogenase, partial [Duncaniella sp.]|nr:dihydrolipoyl dehydrogenase [Duncaniella sp.]